jgi:hypothetical protein
MDLANPSTPGTWSNNTPVLSSLLSGLLGLLGLGTSTLTQITCPTATVCLAVGTAVELNLLHQPVGVACWSLSLSTTNLVWNYLALPSGLSLLSGFSSLTCYGSALCLAVITTTSGQPYIITTPGTSIGLLSWTLTSGLGSLRSVSQVACTGATPECFAIGVNGAVPHLLNLPASSNAWATDTGLPAGLTVSTYSQLACTTASCFAYGTTASGAFVTSLNAPSGTPAWTNDTVPGTLFVSGVACVGSTTTCVAAGASQSGGQLLDWQSGTTTWSLNSASSTLTGLYEAGLPLEVSHTGLQPNAALEVYAPPSASNQADTPELGVQPGTWPLVFTPLFPFPGYSVAAGACLSDIANSANTPGTLVPGRTTVAAGAPTVTVPMGLLSIQAVDATFGGPVSGATVTATLSGCTALTPPSGTTNPASYTFVTSGADGLSRLAVVYETYSVTVTLGAQHNTVILQVTPSAVVNTSTHVSTPLPLPVAVAD